MRPVLVASLAVLLAAPAIAADGPPPAPLRILDVCPLDGCVYGPWTAAAALDVWAREGGGGKPAFRLKPGERFLALTGHLHTHQPAKARVAEDFAWPPGSRNPFDRYTRGSVFWILAPRGDRYYDIWYRGRRRGIRASIAQGRWFMPGRDVAQVLAAGSWTWWVEIEAAGERHGWLAFPDLRTEGVRELRKP